MKIELNKMQTKKPGFTGDNTKHIHHTEAEREQTVAEKFPLPKGLSPMHKELARCMVVGMGPLEASQVCKLSYNYTKQLIHHPKLKAYKQELERKIEQNFISKQTDIDQARATIRKASPNAAQVLARLVLSEDPELARRCAVDILKGAGVIRQEKESGIKQAIVLNIGNDDGEMVAELKSAGFIDGEIEKPQIGIQNG